ncbi:MMPL family transporter [Acuticoccus sp. M5D2P5]|nr:MMPL family transporter [Acuticoccus kalidii]
MPLPIVGIGILLTLFCGFYAANHFAITTDTDQLIASDVSYRQDEIAFAKAFPQTQNLIIAVVSADLPEKANAAAETLATALKARADVFPLVQQPETSEFLKRNGLLFLPEDELRTMLQNLDSAAPLVAGLAQDPSLRGLSGVIEGLVTEARDPASFAAVAPLLDTVAGPIDSALDGQARPLSWQNALDPGAAGEETTRILVIQPVLDFNAIEPGAPAISLLRDLAAAEGIDEANGVSLRLTGPVPLADEEFGTLKENALLNAALTIGAVALILFMALRSGRLIGAVLATLIVGLVVTSALGLFLVGELNMISVAFAVLFIGLGVDFGIQLSTRYRAERHAIGELRPAILKAAGGVGFSLTLAALSLVAGFFSFLPTAFRGVSELGLIAGIGMVVAYIASLTFLPALMTLLRLKTEPRPVDTAALAHVDHWIARNRTLVIALTALVTLAGIPFLVTVEFDSNPMNLRSANVESVSTFLDLTQNPETAPNKLQVLVPSIDDIPAMAERLDALPEVDHTVSVATFLAPDQADKLALIAATRARFAPVFAMTPTPAPTDDETVAALTRGAQVLGAAARQAPEAGEALSSLADRFSALADAPEAARTRAQDALFAYFPAFLSNLKAALSPTAPVTLASLPGDFRADWVAADGRARIEVSPTGDSNDNAVLQRFADSVRTVAPNASGPPIGITEAGKLIVRAFLEAGIFALLAITVILWIALRRVFDVILALGPLVLAGIWTLEFASLIGLSLNFANVIALPLMFGVGIAFHVYYLIAWRIGVADVLASSLTRAIFFSALTTGTAFGSLWASSHPGTSSMGELLAISLVFTLIAAFVVVPAFLGPPREGAKEKAQASA